MLDCDIKEYLNVLIKEKHMTKTEVFEKACIKKFVGFGFLNKDNPRKPSRNNILAMLIVMNCNLDETQTALKIAKYAPLYPKDERDSIIIFGIENSYSINDIEQDLYEHGFECVRKYE